MSQWRREALERFPELHRKIADAENIHVFWFEVCHHLFEPAYCCDPPDQKMIGRIYNYADWCLKHRSIDVRTAVVGSFYEDLMDDFQIRRDMPRWISQEYFDMLHFAWEYTTKQNFADLRREFVENKVRIEKESRTERPRQARVR